MYLPHLHFKVQCVTSTVFFSCLFFQGPAGEIGPPGQQGNPGTQVFQFIPSRQRSTVNTPHIKHTQLSHPLDPDAQGIIFQNAPTCVHAHTVFQHNRSPSLHLITRHLT